MNDERPPLPEIDLSDWTLPAAVLGWLCGFAGPPAVWLMWIGRVADPTGLTCLLLVGIMLCPLGVAGAVAAHAVRDRREATWPDPATAAVGAWIAGGSVWLGVAALVAALMAGLMVLNPSPV